MDAKVQDARYATADRIGVLEELLNERYSVRAFLRGKCHVRPSSKS